MPSYLPILSWARSYDKRWLQADLIAGATVWGVMTPSAMAYAQLAGLPPQHGLYAAMLSLIAYAILGSSRHMKVTTSSTVAVMAASIVGVLGVTDPAQYLALVSALALFAGLGLVIAGAVKLGFIADFLSKPITVGFIFGIAITVFVGQLPKLLGLPGGSGNVLQQLQQLISRLPQFNPFTLAISVAALAGLIVLRRRFPKLPSGLVVLALAIVAVWVLQLEQRGVSLVGTVPQGLPQFVLPAVTLPEFVSLVVGGMGLIFVAAGESLGTARAYANRYRDGLDADQELIALGGSNMAAGLFQGLPVDVSLSTTATADNAGAKTQLSSLVVAGLVAVTLLVLAPLFSLLPNAVLGALVIMSVIGLMDVKGMAEIYRSRRTDFVLAMVALLGVVLSDVLTGLLLAVILALVMVLYRASRPYLAQLGQMPDVPGAYGDMARRPENVPVEGLLIVRMDAPLYYFNANVATRQIREWVAATQPKPRALLLDMGATADLDITSADTLNDLLVDMKAEGIDVLFSHVRGSVRDKLAKLKMREAMDEQHLFQNVDLAVQHYLRSRGAQVVEAWNGANNDGVLDSSEAGIDSVR
jgi:high affinity sulfate transporter 1